jgi:hypothetical protein
MGMMGCRPLMNRHAALGPAIGCPYDAVGMQRALDSAIGLPSRSTSAAWMLVFLMPADVRRSLMLPPGLPVDVVPEADRSATHNPPVSAQAALGIILEHWPQRARSAVRASGQSTGHR